MTQVDDEARELIALAYLDIKENGWHQEDYYTEAWVYYTNPPQGCPACAEGALIRQMGGGWQAAWETADHHSPVFSLAIRIIEEHVKAPLPTWNDERGRTQEEVLDTLQLLAGPEAFARLESKAEPNKGS